MGEAPKLNGEGGGIFFFDSPVDFVTDDPSFFPC